MTVTRAFVSSVLLVVAARSAVAQRPAATQRAAPRPVTGRLEGSIADSLHAAPLAGARVSITRLNALPETTLVTVSDKQGRFRFESVPVGRYAIGFASALLDSLEYGSPMIETEVAANGVAHVELGMPSRRTLRAAACPGVTFEDHTGALLGMVTNPATDRPLVGATLAVTWNELAIDSVTKSMKSGERGVRISTNGAGQYRLCGVPTGEPLLVRVEQGGRAGPVLRVSVTDAVGVALRNLSFGGADAASSAPGPMLALGTASLAGTVRDAAARPVRGAEVRVRGTPGSARTDERGAYSLTGLPSGTRDVEVRRLGYGIARGPVELRGGRRTRLDVELTQVSALDSVRVIARRSSYPEFDRRRREAIEGRFLDESDIERMHVQATSEIVSAIPGFRIVGAGPDARIVSTRSGCAPTILIDELPTRSINDVPPALVGAMELYPSAASAPVTHRSECGTIMIWTKKG